MKKGKHQINELSSHLFWDVEQSAIHWDEHDEFILERVMKYGYWNDWTILKVMFGLNKIKHIAIELKDLDDFSISYLSTILSIEKSTFKCYRLKQSSPNFWHY